MMISETSICNVCGVLNGMVEIARTDPFTYFKYDVTMLMWLVSWRRDLVSW